MVKLYQAGRLFACRHCYRLVHAVQWGEPLDVGRARMTKLYRKLGGTYECLGAPSPDKPKWTRQRTYVRLLAQLEAAEVVHDRAFIDIAAHILARLGKARTV